MNIAYYISGHGFGHAARSQAIIRELTMRGVDVYVRTPTPHKFFNMPGVSYHKERYDIGLIQADALSVHPEATFAWYADFLKMQDSLIEQEVAFIKEQDIQLIVSDMPPIAFEIASKAGIPSIACTHFTWDWVYDGYAAAFPKFQYIIDSVRASYGKATLALQMPFAHAFDMFAEVEEIPLVVNTVTKSKDAIWDEMGVPGNHHLALLSMGGMEWDGMDLSVLRQMTGWTFLVSSGVWEQVQGLPNFRLVSTEYDGYHNLIAAADVLVGKAGWSTIAECIAHRTPMLYTIRDDYRENMLMQDALCKYAKSHFVKKDEFQNGHWAHLLEDMVTTPYRWSNISINGAQVAAERIIALLG